MVIPNEKLAAGTIFNHSTGNQSAPIAVSVWVPPNADVDVARRALDAVGAEQVSVEEVTAEGMRLEVRTSADQPRTRVGGEEAALRERVQAALREAGLLETDRA
jgi:small-conductance mechanosensitive channel